MNRLYHSSLYTAAIFTRNSHFIAKASFHGCCISPWKTKFPSVGIRTSDSGLVLARCRAQCFSACKVSGNKTRSRKMDAKPFKEEEKNAFFVVRKGDIVGVYKSLVDCQAQVGTSICDPPVSVFKGYTMPKDTEEYLVSRGLTNALYTIKAEDLKHDLFGQLVPWPLQLPDSFEGRTFTTDVQRKRPLEEPKPELADELGSTAVVTDPLGKHQKLDCSVHTQAPVSNSKSCILEFDGASRGNPGPAGAGAVLRADNGSVICRLREGLGVVTNNVAEYRAMLLGLKYALEKGYTSIRVLGDSKLVCMQIQGLWKVKNQNMFDLHEEAKKLKDKFKSFQISHVLRGSNSDADAQANFAVALTDGQVQEVFDD